MKKVLLQIRRLSVAGSLLAVGGILLAICLDTATLAKKRALQANQASSPAGIAPTATPAAPPLENTDRLVENLSNAPGPGTGLCFDCLTLWRGAIYLVNRELLNYRAYRDEVEMEREAPVDADRLLLAKAIAERPADDLESSTLKGVREIRDDDRTARIEQRAAESAAAQRRAFDAHQSESARRLGARARNPAAARAAEERARDEGRRREWARQDYVAQRVFGTGARMIPADLLPQRPVLAHPSPYPSHGDFQQRLSPLDLGGGHWIAKNLDNGRMIRLENRTLWQVAPLDHFKTILWLPVTNVTIVEAESAIGVSDTFSSPKTGKPRRSNTSASRERSARIQSAKVASPR